MAKKLRGSLPTGPVVSRDGRKFYLRRVCHAQRQTVIPLSPALVRETGMVQGVALKIWYDGKTLHAEPLLIDNPQAEGAS